LIRPAVARGYKEVTVAVKAFIVVPLYVKPGHSLVISMAQLHN
jgi:hypothetical protein